MNFLKLKNLTAVFLKIQDPQIIGKRGILLVHLEGDLFATSNARPWERLVEIVLGTLKQEPLIVNVQKNGGA